MNVTIKTNRLGIIKILLPYYVVLTFFFVVFWIACAISYEDMKDNISAGITLSSLEGIMILLFICLKFVNRKTYVCTSDKISVYRHSKLIKEYKIDTVICMKYNEFRFRDIFTLLSGFIPDGGYWKFFVFLTNGARITLGIFDNKDVRKLKEIYGELIQTTNSNI